MDGDEEVPLLEEKQLNTMLWEMDFFEKIKDNCKIIFDIGCREDINYIERSDKKIFHLFEPNTKFYNTCKEKTADISNNKIYLNNFGLSNKTGVLNYWLDYQSFFKRTYHLPIKDKYDIVSFSVKKFSEYIIEKKIKKIDFLKIDTEGSEPDILLDDIDFIKNNVKYVQFEYGSTWIDRGDDITFADIISPFESDFTFYILYEESHPIFKLIPRILLTEINNPGTLGLVEHYMRECFGFNIVMINKKVNNLYE